MRNTTIYIYIYTYIKHVVLRVLRIVIHLKNMVGLVLRVVLRLLRVVTQGYTVKSKDSTFFK